MKNWFLVKIMVITDNYIKISTPLKSEKLDKYFKYTFIAILERNPPEIRKIVSSGMTRLRQKNHLQFWVTFAQKNSI